MHINKSCTRITKKAGNLLNNWMSPLLDPKCQTLINAQKQLLTKLFKLGKHLTEEEIRERARSQKIKEKAIENSLSGVHHKEVAKGVSKKCE